MPQVTSADYVIHRFGGVRKTSRLLNLSHSAVSKWRKAGRIPSEHFDEILGKAKQLKVRIDPVNLVAGGIVAKTKKG